MLNGALSANTSCSDLNNNENQPARPEDPGRRVWWEHVSDVPKLNLLKASGCAFANVIFPGLGTIVSSFLGDEPGVNKTQLVVGILQILTAFFLYLIGWMWSIYWAYILVKKAIENRSEEQQKFVPNGAAQS